MSEENQGIWLNKFISESGFCSRREAEKYIDAGKVTINKKVAGKVQQVMPGDVVYVDKQLIKHRKEQDIVFIALYKPVGIVSTTELKIKNNIVDFVNHDVRIFPIGRLDKDSEGLIFMTNNGNLVNKILRAGNNHEKEYIVTVNKPLTKRVISGMANGVPMLGEVTKKCKITEEGSHVFRIILVQGLNRQIRRMCEHFGYEVVRLVRVRIMNITLNGLAPGKWRNLSQSEMKEINKLTKASTSDIEKDEKSTEVKSNSKVKNEQQSSRFDNRKKKDVKPIFNRDKLPQEKPSKRNNEDKSLNKEKITTDQNIKAKKKTFTSTTNKLDKGEKSTSVSHTKKSKFETKTKNSFKAYRNARKK